MSKFLTASKNVLRSGPFGSKLNPFLINSRFFHPNNPRPSGSSVSPIISKNKIKHLLETDPTSRVLGTMVAEIRQPSVMQLLANSGFDFCIIDNEHGPFNIETIADLSRTAKYCGITPIVRIPDLTYPYISQSLDSGAQGIMFPRITTAQQVHELISLTLYPPIGRRGNALSRGYTNFKGDNVTKAMDAVNAETFIVMQIETQEAIDNIEEIVNVPHVDSVLIGPNDLSIALGCAGDLTNEKMVKAMTKVIDACKRSKTGVIPGLHINNSVLLNEWKQKGMRLLSYGSDAGLLVEGGTAINKFIKK